jgi:hypothetical protein
MPPISLVPDPGTKEVKRISTTDLKKLFGGHNLPNWRFLENLGSCIKVFNDVSPTMSIGDVTTIKRNDHGKLRECPPSTLHTVGMDIGYGPGTS